MYELSTHMYQGLQQLLDSNGKVLPYLPAARKRGVLFDLATFAVAASMSAGLCSMAPPPRCGS